MLIDKTSAYDWNDCLTTIATPTTKISYDYKEILNAKNAEIEKLEHNFRVLKGELNKKKNSVKPPVITDIKTPNPEKVVIVEFSDGTKEKAICDDEDKFSLETGIEVCVLKKMLGGKKNYNKYISAAVDLYNNKEKKAQLEKEEKERIARKREKEIARKKRRRERKIAEDIQLKKEAFLLAIKEFNDNTTSIL